MTNFTFIRTPIQEIDETFREEGFTAVERLLNSLNSANVASQNNKQQLPQTIGDFEKTKTNDNFDILLDEGNGRVSRGVSSLLTLSRIIAGRPSGSVRLLSNNIIFSNSKQVLKANLTELRNIVLVNLGIQNLIEPARLIDPYFVDNTIKLVDQMGNDVKHGIFNRTTYEKEIITRSKALVNMSNSSTLKQENRV